MKAVSPNKRCKYCGAKGATYHVQLLSYCDKTHWALHEARKQTKHVKQEQKSREKRDRAKRAEMKENIKTKSDYEQELQAIINSIARLIDYMCPCISSKKPARKMHGGHRFSVGSYPGLRFHLLNVWKQCEQHNFFEGGAPDKYDDSLKEMGAYDLVHKLKRFKTLKATIPELKNAIEVAKTIKAELIEMNSNLTEPRTTAARIYLREEYTERIGLYPEPIDNDNNIYQ